MSNIFNSKTIEKYTGNNKTLNELLIILFFIAFIVFVLENAYHIGYYISSNLLPFH